MKYLSLLILLVAMRLDADVDFWTSYRRDFLRWDIGTEDIDVLSELTWQNLNIWQAGGAARWPLRRWQVELLANGGIIISGETRDSDYSQSGRRAEYGLSTGQSNGYVLDVSLAFGRKCYLRMSDAWLLPEFGLDWHRQFVSDFSVYQLIDYGYDPERELWVIFPTYDLIDEGCVVSTYRADWITGFCGLKVGDFMTPRLFWELVGEIHCGLFIGKGDWKLREWDCFHHIAPALGLSGGLGIFYKIRPRVEPFLRLDGRYWHAFDGVEFISEDGELYDGPDFNGADWRSLAISLGIRTAF